MQCDPEAAREMAGHAKRGVCRGAGMQLISALMTLAGGCAELICHSEHPWASVTFSGSRHTIKLAFAGSEAVTIGELFIAALPDHEFTIPRQLVADAAVVSAMHMMLPEPHLEMEIEVLLLEDA
jgi:hypothetical protein